MNKKAPTEKQLKEIETLLDVRCRSHNALLKKIGNIRKEIIDQLGPFLINEINKNKIILKKNQLGVGVSDEGIEIRIHVNKSSRIDYTISKIDWDGNIRVFPDEDYVDIIDKILPILNKIITKY